MDVKYRKFSLCVLVGSVMTRLIEFHFKNFFNVGGRLIFEILQACLRVSSAEQNDHS